MMRNLLGCCLSISLGLTLGCGGDGGTSATNPGGTATQPNTAAGATATSAGSSASGTAGKAATAGTTGSGQTGASATAGAKAATAGAGTATAGMTAAPAATAGTGAAAAGSGTAAAGASAAAGATAAAGAGAAPTGMGGGSCGPAVDTTDREVGPGPWKVKIEQSTGPSGGSWVFYPEELGKDGIKHAVFDWGPGASTGPSNYMDHLTHIASHGIVVISQPSTQSGTEALDWILAENEKEGSIYYGKLDTARVGQGGHSMGSLLTMSEAADPRLNLYVLVCGGAGGGGGANDIHGPTIILGGDTDIGTPNYEGDYDEITTPVVFLTKSGTDHIACARNNLTAWVAFMRMNWCGEEAKYKPDFMEGGVYCKDPWECKSKSF
jgi:hypothetical protein